MRDDYCDGLGDCLPTCPMDAIHFVEREAAAYDAAAVEENKRKKAAQQAIASQPLPCGCPGTQAKTIRHEQQAVCPTAAEESAAELTSELTQWPCRSSWFRARPYLTEQSFWWLQTVQRMRMRISTKIYPQSHHADRMSEVRRCGLFGEADPDHCAERY